MAIIKISIANWVALWYWNESQKIPEEPRYIRAIRMAFKRPDRWEPWADDRIPMSRFIEYFRMSLEDFRWLSDELREELQLDPLGRGQPLSVEAQVAVGLYRMAHGASYLTIGHVFQIGKETADKTSARFVRAVLKVLRTAAIGYPPLDQPDRWNEIAASFERRQGIPLVVGAIDGTHIPIAVPPGDTWKGYIKRKSWCSIVFQCVVDGEGNFRNVSGGGPGSMHDSRVFRRSRLGQGLLPAYDEPCKIPVDHYLIGDAGYPSTVDILVPYPSVVSPANEWFNFLQSSTRIVVEQAFGRLKNRFRILLHPQRARPIRARNNTFVCMILHNLLNRRGGLYLHNWDTRSPQELQYAEIRGHHSNKEPGDSSKANLPTGQVSMWVRRDIIHDVLYDP
ncbi:hypothetical protein MJO28_013229 [Puccinia striiformis f. sp. tritici]|uniref:Uncharacterized protein n=1 Tax=Puccinia striiformis f. sp. tritici TaxID=168172 RepID=A0ACC0DY04_9BASI|nr:hypothetical protein MJO28_013229 [Puccinia striiformis f. sp. tritici]